MRKIFNNKEIIFLIFIVLLLLSIKHIFEKIVNEVNSKIANSPDEDLFDALLSIQEYPNKKQKDLLIDTFFKVS